MMPDWHKNNRAVSWWYCENTGITLVMILDTLLIPAIPSSTKFLVIKLLFSIFWHCLVLFGIVWYCLVLFGIFGNGKYCLAMVSLVMYCLVMPDFARYCKVMPGFDRYCQLTLGMFLVLLGIAQIEEKINIIQIVLFIKFLYLVSYSIT